MKFFKQLLIYEEKLFKVIPQLLTSLTLRA